MPSGVLASTPALEEKTVLQLTKSGEAIMTSSASIFDDYQQEFEDKTEVDMSVSEYLNLCKEDPKTYASAVERLLDVIGEPEVVDTSKDTRLSRIFQGRTIERFPAFKDFYGMEETIGKIVGFLRHAKQGLEEKKQVLYLLGPVGSAKSSLAERIKEMIEQKPIYALAVDIEGEDGQITREVSPVFESPLGLFQSASMRRKLTAQYGVPARKLPAAMSPWAAKRLKEFGGDPSKFKVVKIWPSRTWQTAVIKVEPGDENNQDISVLTGKPDIRKLEKFAQNDPDAYSFSGGLNRGNQGVMEFVEMFKAPIKVLHPLLTATQEGNYTGTEAIGAIPFDGLILAHSNESEWEKFRSNRDNEAFLDRVCIVEVPYTLQASQEAKIYQKYMASTELADAPCAPQTLEMLAKWSVMTRLKLLPGTNLNALNAKMRVYDGENLKEIDPKSKTVQEYRNAAGRGEGFDGSSTRFAFKTLSATFNLLVKENDEVGADPVKLMNVLEEQVKALKLPVDEETKRLALIKDELAPRYAEFIGNEIQKAFLESYKDYGQNLYDEYVALADAWIEDQDYKDPDTGVMLKRDDLNQKLTTIEKPAGIANPKDFRNEVVKFVLRKRGETGGRNPSWTAYEKMRDVIEKKMFSSFDEMLPIISFTSKKDAATELKHSDFVTRMKAHGYTPIQARRTVDWYMRAKKAM
jgi:serine protein kinase